MPARALIAAACSLVIVGCGAHPPQAPPALAGRVAEALSGIAQACGEQAQLSALPAFGPARAQRAATLASARMRALELRHATARDQAWIYQGKTLQQVRGLAAQKLRECGLGAAAVGL